MRVRRVHWRVAVAALGAIIVAIGVIAATAAAALAPEQTTVAGGAGSSTVISHWLLQSSANAQQGGAVISQPGLATKGWYPVGARTTVMAGLLANGLYPNVFFGTNLRAVQVPDTDHHRFQIPWWYRATFQVAAGSGRLHTFIRINGIIPRADVWLNGQEIADQREVAGAFTTHILDVSHLVHAGTNILAVKVYPASPQRDLSIGWIDWNPAPPDNNMGIWRDVDIVRTGPVAVDDLHVVSKLKLPQLDSAALTVKAELRNHSDAPENVVVSGRVAGILLERRVHLAAHQIRAVTFSPHTDPALKLAHPKVWWPAGLGAQPLYQATLSVRVNGALSDRAATTFGIRDVSSHLTAQGYRQFVVNGKPLLIRGAGWSPDMFLRDQPQRLATEFRYIRNLGLNAVRTEGKLERPDFYKLADENGIMVLAGWECCDKWEAWAKTGGEPWDAADMRVARLSMVSEARRLRDHPSVIAFLIGSDNAPPPKLAKLYVDALHAADWPDPIISAASDQKTAVAGPSGMKMSGPYAWVPPAYWYADQRGGAFGFNSETSAGIDIPRLSSLRNMLTPRALEALWQDPGVKQFHAAPEWSRFSSLQAFDAALAHRYGAPKSLADYVEKAQLANYAAVRAQFEAYNARMSSTKPSTGVIYWMLSNGWPSLHWHLFGYDLNPAGAYFGAQKANQPIHIQYAYDDHAVVVVNHTLRPLHGLAARIRVYNLDGSVRYERKLSAVDVPANRAQQLAVIPALQGLSGVYFVELELTTARGRTLSRNVYWLSTHPDQLDWTKSNWYTTPVSRYADFTSLQQLAQTKVTVASASGGQGIAQVTVTNPPGTKSVALFMHLSLRQPDGRPLLPVTWSSNDISLWPGESETLTVHYPDAGAAPPTVKLSGWNIKPSITSVAAGHGKTPRNCGKQRCQPGE